MSDLAKLHKKERPSSNKVIEFSNTDAIAYILTEIRTINFFTLKGVSLRTEIPLDTLVSFEYGTGDISTTELNKLLVLYAVSMEDLMVKVRVLEKAIADSGLIISKTEESPKDSVFVKALTYRDGTSAKWSPVGGINNPSIVKLIKILVSKKEDSEALKNKLEEFR